MKVKQLSNGSYAVFEGEKYFPHTVTLTKRMAEVNRLWMVGQRAQRTIDRVDKELEKLGAFNERDPHDYLA